MPIPGIISAAHLAPARGFFEPQRSNNWTLEIALDDVGDQLLIMSALEELEIPTTTIQPLELRDGNEVRKVAGSVTFQAVQLTLKDFIDMNVAQAVERWFRQVYNAQTGSIGLARDYKKSADIILTAPDMSRVRVWKLEGVWPSSVSRGRLSKLNVDKIQYTVTLEIDTAYPGVGFSLLGINPGLTDLPL